VVLQEEIRQKLKEITNKDENYSFHTDPEKKNQLQGNKISAWQTPYQTTQPKFH